MIYTRIILRQRFCHELHCNGYGMEPALARFSFFQEGIACPDPWGDHSDRCRPDHRGPAGDGRVPDFNKAQILPAPEPPGQQAHRY